MSCDVDSFATIKKRENCNFSVSLTILFTSVTHLTSLDSTKGHTRCKQSEVKAHWQQQNEFFSDLKILKRPIRRSSERWESALDSFCENSLDSLSRSTSDSVFVLILLCTYTLNIRQRSRIFFFICIFIKFHSENMEFKEVNLDGEEAGDQQKGA